MSDAWVYSAQVPPDVNGARTGQTGVIWDDETCDIVG